MPNPIQNHLNALAQRAHTDEGALEAHNMLALFDPEQDLETFRARCLTVPLVHQDGRWCIPGSMNDEMWRDLAGGELKWGQPEATPEACRAHFDTMVDGAQDTLPEQPLLPVLMASTQQWLLFYAADLFDAFRAHATHAPLHNATDVAHLHELQLCNGDPITWFFDRLVETQVQQRSQREQDLQDGCQPENQRRH